MKRIILTSFLFLAGCAGNSMKENKKSAEALPAKPDIAFTVTEGISHPESALYSDTHKTIFVSNVASGNPMETKRVGYISKISADGALISSQWVKNLKAPKGMAIVGNHLYVSDVDEVVKIDIAKSRIIKTWKVAGAKFLNDVVADKNGNVYISDMNANVIHIIKNNVIKDWIRSPALRGPNGLYSDGAEHVIMAQWGSDVDSKTWMAKNPGHLAALSLKTDNTKFVEESNLTGHLDGIDVDNRGTLFVSDWISGDVWSVQKNGKAEKRFNFGQGTADLSVARELNLLLIPQMNQSKLIAIRLK